MRVTCCLALAATVVAGCNEGVTHASEINYPRLRGARVDIVGEDCTQGEASACRATPRPDERIRVRFELVNDAHDWDPGRLQSLFIACPRGDELTGIPFCAGLDGFAAGDSPGALPDQIQLYAMGEGEGLPELELDVDSLVEKGQDILLLGVICDGSAPDIDEEQDGLPFVCADPASRREITTFTVEVAWEDDAPLNLHPGLPAQVWLDAQLLPPIDTDRASLQALAEQCAEGEPSGMLPFGDIEDREAIFELRFDDDAREADEDLLITYATSFGKLRQYPGDIDAEDRGLVETNDWLLPDEDDEEAQDSPQLVRFSITVRDDRGGFSVTQRAFCLCNGACS